MKKYRILEVTYGDSISYKLQERNFLTFYQWVTFSNETSLDNAKEIIRRFKLKTYHRVVHVE